MKTKVHTRDAKEYEIEDSFGHVCGSGDGSGYGSGYGNLDGDGTGAGYGYAPGYGSIEFKCFDNGSRCGAADYLGFGIG